MTPTECNVLCAGIVVADHLCHPIDHLPAAGELVMTEKMVLSLGGCAANTAVDLAKMGERPAVVGRVGDDLFGRIVAEMLTQHGVDVRYLRKTPDQETSQTLIVNVRGEDRRFIHSFGANAAFVAEDIPGDRLAAVRVLYVGGYLVMPKLDQAALAAVFARARKAGVTTVLDVVVPGPGDHLDALRQLLPEVDVFLPNTDEAAILTGEKDPVSQAKQFHDLGAGTVIITLGAAGSVLWSDDAQLRAGAFPVTFVDGSGGGDAFAAGYIYGLLHEMDVVDRLRYASALGASCVQSLGTTPGVFTRDECEKFLSEHVLEVTALS